MKRMQAGGRARRRTQLLLLMLPFVVFVFVFSYLPLFGWSYAFVDYIPGLPLAKQQFAGFKYFELIFSGGNDFAQVIRNTLALSFLSIAASPVPIAFAVLLAEWKRRKLSKFVQTVTSVPNFISWTLVYAVFFAMFSMQDGAVNKLLLHFHWIDVPTNLLGNDKYAWYIQLLVGLWKGTGWSAIIYIAAMAGIDQELYDAAEVDGAGRLQKIRHITIPGIMPTYFVLLLLAVSNMLNNGFEQYYVFQNPLNVGKLEVFDTYVYKVGIARAEFAFSTAMGIFKSGISILLLLFANYLSKAARKESLI